MAKLMTQSEYARYCGVNKSTVNRWIKNGRIEIAPTGLIDVAAADKMRYLTESSMPHHQARKEQFEDQWQRNRSQSPQSDPAGDDAGQSVTLPSCDAQIAPEPPLGPESVILRTKIAALREREAKAELANLEIDQRTGLLVDRADVEYVLADYAAILVGQMERLADRLTPEVMTANNDSAAIHKIIDDSAREILNELSAKLNQKS